MRSSRARSRDHWKTGAGLAGIANLQDPSEAPYLTILSSFPLLLRLHNIVLSNVKGCGEFTLPARMQTV